MISHAGPSPRGWGERGVARIHQRGNRTIPTRVGRTRSKLRPHRPRKIADHPHAGGENKPSAASSRAPLGPSPRGWGERGLQRRRIPAERTIPTRVGRTRITAPANTSGTDHPHAGGENLAILAFFKERAGPSPRGWGERCGSEIQRFRRRTIPTRVGRTCLFRPTGTATTDHPHAGGENESPTRNTSSANGPSPRGWGELSRHPITIADTRTIPTRVGRTGRRGTFDWPTADHPHAGGENSSRYAAPASEYGPSPRGWGEHPGAGWQLQGLRTIPTRVGRTSGMLWRS